MPLEVKSGSDGAPYAVRTTLGWTLHGSIACQSPQPVMCMFTFSDMPEKVSQDDIHVIKHWDANTKTVDGHYEIPVPWSDSTFIPPETRCMAKMPHDALCVRLNAKPEINVMCNKQPDNRTMDTMISSGYAEEVPHADPPSDSSWYLSHHHVYSPDKPAKVRVVFDCSVRSRGSSLNDRAYQGPKLTTLLNVVLLCIMYSCVISGDVQAMYNQVKVPVGNRDMMRFLWNGRAYRKTSNLFGDSWCATSALHALRRRWKLVQRLADKFWPSWSKQYITELQSRVKWQTDQANLKIGDLLLVVDELKHRNQWTLGRVGYVSYSRDGLVRSVRVMTATTEYVRPITKVVLL